jgi:nucleotide-binding universal stress UspA family protein
LETIYLVGVDGSNCGQRAIEYVMERARENGGKILAAHVIEWSPYSFSTPEENEHRHQRREQELTRARDEILAPVVERFREAGIPGEGLAAHGHVAKTVVRLAQEHEVTCIVLGRKGSSRLAQFFGSVASHVVQISDRPVTVVP